jgi:hypothetical protein
MGEERKRRSLKDTEFENGRITPPVMGDRDSSNQVRSLKFFLSCLKVSEECLNWKR